MKIQISNTKKLEELKEEFNQFFPFLTFEFFENLSSDKVIIPNGFTIGKFRRSKDEETLAIFGEMSVSDLEQIMKEHFEIPVRVLRKSGDVWLATTHTDAWSLAQQNKLGQIVSDQLGKQKPNKPR